MITVEMKAHSDFEEWRAAARLLLNNEIDPSGVDWASKTSAKSLFNMSAKSVSTLQASDRETKVPKTFVDIAKRVICYRDGERFARLYKILWRLQAEPSLMKNSVDPDVIWLTNCDKAIRRDRHKMHAFVRFRKVGVGRFHREQFAAWFEPSHYITELATPFFMRRFPNMDWVIVTPECTAIWDGKVLRFGPGGLKSDVPTEDAVEDQWQTYFTSIFNPARLKVGAMMAEMPKKYWKNMPEAESIPGMIRTARLREHQMKTSGVTLANPLAERLRTRLDDSFNAAPIENLAMLEKSLQVCRRCPLYACASQAVSGEGPENAKIMIIGEQPGDQEDIAGRPFIGPAGQILNEALESAGIDRSETYVTNAVKHFKFTSRGKRRIHERPNAREIDHCRWWLETERILVKPDIIIALGASAARSVLGRSVNITEMRGQEHIIKSGERLFITVHPSYLLRLPNVKRQSQERAAFIRDLSLANSTLSAA